ncbi:MAG: rhodanese-like domain-containing protein [Nanobdellota archaeon]
MVKMDIITSEALFNMMQDKIHFILINVLNKEGYKRFHIPGSINIPFEDINFINIIEKIIPDKKEVIVIYSADYNSSESEKAAETLEKYGYENVYNFEDGIKGWDEEGYDISIIQ